MMTEGMDRSTAEQLSVLDNISETVQTKSNDEIESLIKETEETLSILIGELKRRQQDDMHKEIENLDEYMEQADISFENLRKFIAMVFEEIRGKSK